MYMYMYYSFFSLSFYSLKDCQDFKVLLFLSPLSFLLSPSLPLSLFLSLSLSLSLTAGWAAAHLFEGLPDGVRVRVIDRIPQPLQGTVDGLPVLRLEVPLVGGLRRLGGHGCQVLQYPQQLRGGGGGRGGGRGARREGEEQGGIIL